MNEMKICNEESCEFANQEQNINNFAFRNKKENIRKNICKNCQNKETNERILRIQNDPNIKLPDIKTQICSDKICKFLGQEQDILNFYTTKDKKYTKRCKDCYSRNIKLYNSTHKQEKSELDRQYRSQNKSKIRKRQNQWAKNKRNTEPVYKLKQNVSHSIQIGLQYNNSSKRKKSCWKYLPFTLEELKKHIESLFEPWMHWNNQGKYIKSKWNDNNPATWKWQLDHIIPHSKFNYTNMECQEFKDCWALSNLRPYSAKLNVKEGNRR